MIASELLMLNTSSCGDTVKRFSLKVFCTFRSSWLIRSVKVVVVGTRLTVAEVDAAAEPMKLAGRMTAPAGHGAAQFAGYRVVPRVITIVCELFGPWLLWNEPLNWIPYGSGYEPASLN